MICLKLCYPTYVTGTKTVMLFTLNKLNFHARNVPIITFIVISLKQYIIEAQRHATHVVHKFNNVVES